MIRTRLFLAGAVYLGIILVTGNGCSRDESPKTGETAVPKPTDSASSKAAEHDHAATEPCTSDHTGHASHEHGETPKSYAAAIEAIEAELDEMEKLLATGDVSAAHGPCDAIVGVSSELPKLAMAAGSGVAKGDVKAVNQMQKLLAAKAEQAHTASEKGEADGLRAVHTEMVTLLGKLHALATDAEHDHDHDHDHPAGSAGHDG